MSDVYEADDIAERAVDVGSAEYELPSDFEDEEIDEDSAFNDADELEFGAMLPKNKASKKKGKRKGKKNKASSKGSLGRSDDVGTEFDEKQAPAEGEVFLSDLIGADDKEKKPVTKGAKKENIQEYSDDEEMESSKEDANLLSLAQKATKKHLDTAQSQKDRSEQMAEGQYISTKRNAITLETMMSALADNSGSQEQGELKQKLSKLMNAGKIDKPNEQVVEDRATRKAGYENAKSHVTKWTTIVQENRQAKSLSFPLDQPKRVKPTTASLNSNFTPKTELELQIQTALAESGLASESDIVNRENDELMEITEDVEDMKSRRAELAKLRALMFYDEQKNKRQKKIKSKMFRKIRKRRLAREEEKTHEEIRRLDPDGAKDLDEKAALKRAHERMTLKHKNTSKFIRGLLKNGGVHRSRTREAIIEQLDEEHQLRRKMQTMDSDSEGDGDDVEGFLDEIKNDKIKHDGVKKKGLYALQFMQKGLEKKRQQAEDNAKALLKAVESGELDETDDLEVDPKKPVGRRTFSTAKVNKKPVTVIEEDKTVESSKDSDNSQQKTGFKSSGFVKASGTFEVPEFSNTTNLEESNPWLSSHTSKRHTNNQHKSKSNSVVDVSQAVASPSKPQNENIEQQKLLKRAFVNAGVAQQDFEAEKEQAAEEGNGKKEKNMDEVAGWGSWTGSGVVNLKKKKKKNTMVPKKRKKDKLPHVLISNKRNKKSEKYKLDKVPYPFTSREQYERSLQNPIGSDWNTMSTFEKVTKPSVITKVGTIIPPLAKNSRYDVNYAQRHSTPA